jgi:hypothetical protein|tara:strand:+ start:687 stop:854 length:168 start_codon:yes stop_codon:yes gene_type:complete
MTELFAQLEFLENLLCETDPLTRTRMIRTERNRVLVEIEENENYIQVEFGDGMEM